MSLSKGSSHVADVSVVIPCYCCEGTIRRAVSSVYAQTLRPRELILVNDCSPGKTLETLKDIQSEYASGWITVVDIDDNGGPGRARNLGWACAKGSFIAFLDADDSWHSRKIEIQYEWMLGHPSATLTGQKSVLKNSALDVDQIGSGSHSVDFSRVDKNTLLYANKFSTSSVMITSCVPHRFPESRSYSEDYELWCDIAFDPLECFVMGQAFTYAHKALYGSGGLSSHLWKMEQGELLVFYKLRQLRKISFPTYVGCWSWSIIRYFKRCLKIYLPGS